MMKERLRGFVLIASLMSLIAAVSAQPQGFEQSITVQDLAFFIFLGLIIIIVAYFILQKIFKRGPHLGRKSPIICMIGSFISFLCIGLGSFLIILFILVLLSEFAGVSHFMTAHNVVATIYNGDVFMGLVVALVGGATLFVLGLLGILLIHGEPPIDKRGMPTGSGATSKGKDAPEISEPLNPTIRFRVIHRRTDLPASDVKIILKERSGHKFHSKFTEFNGEVKFSNIEGYAQDYYAYVEGDEMREDYRVILI